MLRLSFASFKHCVNLSGFPSIDAIVGLAVAAFALLHPALRSQFEDRLLHQRRPSFDLLVQQPPVQNPFECVPRLRVFDKVSQYLPRDV